MYILVSGIALGQYARSRDTPKARVTSQGGEWQVTGCKLKLQLHLANPAPGYQLQLQSTSRQRKCILRAFQNRKRKFHLDRLRFLILNYRIVQMACSGSTRNRKYLAIRLHIVPSGEIFIFSNANLMSAVNDQSSRRNIMRHVWFGIRPGSTTSSSH
jgi:hypothetical protein